MKVRCSGCRKYLLKEDAIKRGLSHFCNDECFRSKTQEKRKRGSMSSKTDIDPELRRRILERDGQHCRWCCGNGPLNVHHIHFRSEGELGGLLNDERNLMALCAAGSPLDHHARAHENKKLYQPVLIETLRREYEDHHWVSVGQVLYEMGLS